MEFVEPDDEPTLFRTPLPPDDRLWRHPSEVAAVADREAKPSVWTVAVISALAASMLSTGLVLVVGSLLDGQGPDERQAVPLRAAAPVAAGDVVEIAQRARPAIAQLRVDKGRAGAGSGVVFRSDGHLLTNAHVVDGASAVRVTLGSGREVPARVVGADPDTDTAVVKIEGGPFPVATLGSAKDLKVGQQAIAIGSPLGLAGGPSVTVGVISALHRTVRTRTTNTTLFDMMQTDAPIAPGSSGGALLDTAGNVIGITTAVAVSEGGTEGFGFATPIDVARSVAEQLIATGRVSGVWLGIQGTDLDGVMATDLDVDGGAVVGEVRAGGPAYRGGISARDVIVGVDGAPVESMGALVTALRRHRPGDSVTVEVVRDHRRYSMRVTLDERPAGS